MQRLWKLKGQTRSLALQACCALGLQQLQGQILWTSSITFCDLDTFEAGVSSVLVVLLWHRHARILM